MATSELTLTSEASTSDALAVERDELVIDLDARQLRIGGAWSSFESPAADAVFARYLDAVHDLRGRAPVASITLRADDIEVLGDALDLDPRRVRRDLSDRLHRTRTPSRRWLLVAVSALSFVAVGVLIALAVLETPGAPPETGLAEAAATDELAAPQVRAAGIGDATRAAETSAVSTASVATTELSPRAGEIEAAIDWDFRSALPGWTIRYEGPHTMWRGVTNSVERTVTLFDRPDASIEEAAAVLVHELGHAIDLERLDDAMRTEWLELRGMPMVWWVEDGRSDFAVGAGDFAEAVAAQVLGAPSESR